MGREKIPVSEIKRVLKDEITKKKIKRLSENRFERIEIQTESFDPLLWLKAQPQKEKIYFEARGKGEPENAVVGSIFKLSSSHNEKLSSSFKNMKDILENEARFFGGISFFRDRPQSNEWKSFGAYNFILPRFEYILTDKKALFAMNYQSLELSKEKIKSILNEINSINLSIGKRSQSKIVSTFNKYSPDKKGWITQVSSYLDEIKSGKIEKIVAARRLELDNSGNVDPYDITFKLKSIGNHSACFLVSFNDKDFFIGLTPERLFHRNKKFITSESVAGTVYRGKDRAEDKILGNELLSSKKDILEHDIVTKDILKNLDPLCEHLTISEIGLLKLSNIQHLYKKISGKLKNNISDGDILEEISPTPAVSGMPQEESKEILKREESFDRGWYAGVIGFAGKDISDYYVGIRSILVSKKRIYVYSGAGIVKGSDPEKEWDEINLKSDKYKKILNYED